ncbi:DnaB-like helicase N-terminal domain-containing protein [Streptomyces sp. gCLA4]|uniref:DnaB-like helicase N-terminal domain-containing protein n=1 Tax=Streptomyces sp. gCLA4 TaxID=1873416 RepID=UPI001603B94B|nr:DnaB-like helicase N-terminal domain-containing protein [Streptomyces sp. gCLA4]
MTLTLVGTPDRAPSGAHEAERQLLGLMLMQPDAVKAAARQTLPEDFRDPRHAAIYLSVLAVAAMGEPVDPVTVGVHLARRAQLDTVGGHAYLHDLVMSAPYIHRPAVEPAMTQPMAEPRIPEFDRFRTEDGLVQPDAPGAPSPMRGFLIDEAGEKEDD